MTRKFTTTKEEYDKRLEQVANLTHEDLIIYLANNNVVRAITEYWLVIENCKYHQKDPVGKPIRTWLTAFALTDDFLGDIEEERVADIIEYARLNQLAVHMHPSDERTIEITHYHLTEIPNRDFV
jgi:hypothetical protein